LEKLHETAELLKQFEDFSSFSKRHTDVNTFNCTISESYWEQLSNHHLIYHVKSNRFLRGMVKAMVGTQLLVGRGKLSLDEFKEVLLAKDCTKADFSPPSMGLFLENVIYPADFLQNPLPYK
jgi:tRNA pseudouridine38-40 synthase